jgi:hypothetical protein
MAAISVLFVGNSYTYCHEMPTMLSRLADGVDGGPAVNVEVFVQGGVTLGWHSRQSELAEKLAQDGRDAVVLQEQSRRPVENREAMFEAAARLHGAVEESGARTVFFMTWARRDEPDMQEPLEGAYTEIAQKLGAEVAPVGVAWQIARQKPASPVLYEEDGSHPTPAGGYLTACVFYAVLTGESPMGLPAQVEVGDKTVALTEEQARALQDAAREAVASVLR